MKITILAAAALVAWAADLQKRPVASSYESWIAGITAAQTGPRKVSPEAEPFAAWLSNYPTN